MGGAVALLVIGLLAWELLMRGEEQGLQGRVERPQSQPPGPRAVELGDPGANSLILHPPYISLTRGKRGLVQVDPFRNRGHAIVVYREHHVIALLGE